MRLPHVTGDPIAFRFAGRRVVGHAGDSVAAALHDAGIKIWSRSRKFHRARGLSGTFVAGHAATVDGLPHVRLDRCAAEAGMRVDMQNVWPGPRLDLLRLARLMPRRWLKAGFEQDLYVSVPRGQGELLKATLTSLQPLLAPVSRQQRVGVLRLAFDGKPLGEYPVVALESVSVANVFVRIWDGLRLLFN